MEKFEPRLNMVPTRASYSDPLVSSQTRPHVVKLARTVDLFTAEKRKTANVSKLRPTRMGQSFDNAQRSFECGRGCEFSPGFTARALQASPQAYSKLRCNSKVSLRAYPKLRCKSKVSLRAFLSIFEPSGALAPKSQIRSHTLALKLRTRSH